ncbi:MAG: preprotein translocase subunit SecA [Firmicutes bacterium]|nr:preprotein translocase subunit SecA [Bacillota bacterium]
MLSLLKNLFDSNRKEIQRLEQIVEVIDSWEPEIQKISDADLKAKTGEFKARLDKGETLDDLLPEAFAVVREAAKRTLGQRHYGVQLMGGIVLHEGNIAEMKTGEGKTLAATAPVYLNALTGKGVHVVTVNDYLAKRDAEWMGQVYRFLGLSVGVILHGMDSRQRKQAYACDITYGTNNEFGFDYLRDNMVVHPDQLVQRELNYAIVDEVDSILIDEARTPLIISGESDQPTELYYRVAKYIPLLKPEEDYTVDEKAKACALTEEGVAKMEKFLGVENLFDPEQIELNHSVNQALRAYTLMKRDRDYVVKDGEVIIVDEFTGRLMPGRRYSNGLHQAIEAKEGVTIKKESQTLATITFQNYFRMYNKLAGMTGTAKTEEEEFRKIYGLDVIVIPTNKPMIRVDYPDVVYKTEKAKLNAIVEEVASLYQKERPVLVGTISIEMSERLSQMLKRRGIPHNVLNAKYHEKEAEIVAQAGRSGTVTIATNMAGRGTDIVLGGNPKLLAQQELRRKGYDQEVITYLTELRPGEEPPADHPEAEELQKAFKEYQQALEKYKAETSADAKKVKELGGLFIIGTERHESRRIDNQLRGRSGRQGDPGASRFYVSLEDDLMRLFGSERIASIMDRLGWEEDQPIEHPQIAKSIENAQKKVEARNFDIRKQVLQFDDVMNQQRKVIYEQRRKVLLQSNLQETILSMLRDVVQDALDTFISPEAYPEDWDREGLVKHLSNILILPENTAELVADINDRDELRDKLVELGEQTYKLREDYLGSDQMRLIEKLVLLRVIDSKWMDHLKNMDDLREGIGLRAYGQRDPLMEYQFEAHNLFDAMISAIKVDTVRYVYRVELTTTEAPRRRVRNVRTNRDTTGSVNGTKPTQRRVKKIGRNDPCPCGSGKKYKKCCLNKDRNIGGQS